MTIEIEVQPGVKIQAQGYPPPEGIPKSDLSSLRLRVSAAYQDCLADYIQDDDAEGRNSLEAPKAATPKEAPSNPDQESDPVDDEFENEFEALDPVFTFDSVILSEHKRDEIETAAATLRLRSLVFDEWGLRQFEPFPSTALNFVGPPGTGKTMCAHALASQLGLQIVIAKISQLESRYVGDGPKRISSLFSFAEKHRCLLFVDEADALVSKRISNVSQGSEQSANSMRSEVIQALDRFSGISIFASNFAESYDEAIRSRLIQVSFNLPDAGEREALWKLHLLPNIPGADSVDPTQLAPLEGLSGRDIRRLVVLEATRAAMVSGEISEENLLSRAAQLLDERTAEDEGELEGREPTDEERSRILEAIERDEQEMVDNQSEVGESR